MPSFRAVTPIQQICGEELSAVSAFTIPTVFISPRENWQDQHLSPARCVGAGSLDYKERKSPNPISQIWWLSLWSWGNCRTAVKWELKVTSSCLSKAHVELNFPLRKQWYELQIVVHKLSQKRGLIQTCSPWQESGLSMQILFDF